MNYILQSCFLLDLVSIESKCFPVLLKDILETEGTSAQSSCNTVQLQLFHK